MGHTQPKFPLTGHCSVVHDDTLYVYSSAGFQSLKLQEGAEWTALPMDISLTGATCVNAESDGKMYVVGGSVNATASGWNYPGLMHYTFADQKWDWVRPESWPTQNRHNHAAVYLDQVKKLLVYSGSQTTGDNGPSSQTFLISTVAPFTVESKDSNGAPPLVKPMLMNMDDQSALLIGGSAGNTAAWKFSVSAGWQNLGVTLQQPFANQDAVQCTVISGKGQSKMLERFDMAAVPNKVDRILLLKEDGTPAAPGATPSKAKRVTVQKWADYNATFAPTSARSGYSLAQAQNGLTVASGGNPADPVVLFDSENNSWRNATALFVGQHIISNAVSSSSASPISTPTSTPVSSTVPKSSTVPNSSTIPTSFTVTTSSAVPTSSASGAPIAAIAAAPASKSKMLTVLGATLGTILGIAAILILILICLKHRKNKSKQRQGYVEKDRMSFADRGADFMKEAGGSEVTHNYNMGNNNSHSSLAIMQGRGANGHKKNMASDASNAGLVKKTSPLGYSEPVELSKLDIKPESTSERMVQQNSSRVPPAKSNPRARSSGWSKYFANNEATNLANAPDRSTYASDRTSTGTQSQYTNSRLYHQHLSQQITPLEIPKFDSQRLSRVASGSPTLGSSTGTLPHQVQPMQAELGRTNSNASTRSGLSYDGHLDRDPVENWTPVGKKHRASSTYTNSLIFDTPKKNSDNKHDATSSYYHDNSNSSYPKSEISSFYQGQETPIIPDYSTMYPSPIRPGVSQERDSTVTVFPGIGASQAKPSASNNEPGSFYLEPRVGHDSTVTVFPAPSNSQAKSQNGQSDMSWLNLGTTRS
ncbi:hypothetical protein ACEQ8H_003789 [Pleosporales sp. CAS-2024a]